MKIKVMIVDDEYLSLEYVSTLIHWESYGFELIPFAENGKHALSLYDEYHPDVVITDVAMPVMNGIELAYALREKSKDVIIVFITSFSDFAFARDALRIGAYDYVLKEELTQHYMLNKMINIKNAYFKQNQSKLYFFKNELEKFFNKTSLDAVRYNPRSDISDLFYDRYDAYVLDRLMPIPEILREAALSADDTTDNFNEIAALIEGDGGSFVDIITVSISANRILVLKRPENGKGGEERTVFGKNLLKRISKDRKMDFVVYVLRGNLDIFSVYRNYMLIKDKLKRAFFDGAGIYNADELTYPEEHGIDQQNFIAFSDALDRGADSSAAIEIIEKALYPSSVSKNYDEYVENVINLARILHQRYMQLYNVSTGLSVMLYNKNDRKKWYTAQSIKEWLKDSVRNLFLVRSSNVKENYSKEVILAVEYIRKHYSNPELGVEEIAAALYISKSKISTMFKNDTGKTILEYITYYRIEKAKQFIDMNMKIFNVSTKVGYKNSQYFCTVFKKITGISPGEYKKGVQIEEK